MSQLQAVSLIPTPIWKVSIGNKSGDQKLSRDIFNQFRSIPNLKRNDSGIDVQQFPQFRSRIPIPVKITKCHQIILTEDQLPIRSSDTTTKESSSFNNSSSSSNAESFPAKRPLKSRTTNVFVPVLKFRGIQKSSVPSYFNRLKVPPKKKQEYVENELAIKLNQPYLSDIMTQALLTEAKYKVNYKCQPLGKREHFRRKFVNWVISAGQKLKYTDETAHLTVYIIDAFLVNKWENLLLKCWPLLALAALHLAAKFEEVKPTKLSRIIQSYAFLREYKCLEVNWMEMEILDELGFDICPPTSKFFADLSINSGQIDFPSEHIKRLTLKLTHAILLESLKEYSLTEVFPSTKAKIAVQISTEYINKFKSPGASPTNRNKDIIGPESIRKCFALFCQTLNRPPKVQAGIIKPVSVVDTRRGV